MQVANLSSIWTVCYTRPSRYNWMFQYYLRAEGLALSWVGTGRLIFSLNYTDADFEAVADRFVAAAEAMRRDGWWWPIRPRPTSRSSGAILREMLARTALPPRLAETAPPEPCRSDRPPLARRPTLRPGRTPRFLAESTTRAAIGAGSISSPRSRYERRAV